MPPPLVARPFAPVYLHSSQSRTRSSFFALLDSGADRVLLPADLANEVGINQIETGRLEPAVGIGSQRVDIYYHPLALQVLGDTRKLETEVGFSAQIMIPILGRSFFRHFRAVIFEEMKEQVELKS